MAAASFSDVLSFVISVANATQESSPGTFVYSTSISDDRYTLGEIKESIFEADVDVRRAAYLTPDHWMRTNNLTNSSDLTTYPSPVPAHIGELGPAEIKVASVDTSYIPAEPAPRQFIQELRSNSSSVFGSAAHNTTNSPLGGFYEVMDGLVWFTGYSIRFRIATLTIDRAGPSLGSDEAYTGAIVAGALARLFSKEGASEWAATFYQKQFEGYLSQIQSGARVVPEVQMYQERQAA